MELSSIRRCFIAHRESNDNTDFPTLYSSLHFNQRTRMGCDTIWCLLPPPKFRFNPRTRMGCDTAKVGELLPVYWFQSTHPHGVRLYTQQRAEYHSANLPNLRITAKYKQLKLIFIVIDG